MPMLRMIDHGQHSAGVVDPFWGMLVHPRSTMHHLIEHNPGEGAYLMAVLFSLSSGLALYFGGVEYLSYVELPVMLFFLVFAGIFFLMSTTAIVKSVSSRYFGADASSAEIRTSIAWSLAPAVLCNSLAILLAVSPWVNFPLELAIGIAGIVWSFVLMDHSMGEAEAYGDGPALLVLSFAGVCMVLAVAIAYLPMWLLTPFVNAWIWYG